MEVVTTPLLLVSIDGKLDEAKHGGVLYENLNSTFQQELDP